MIPTVSEKLNDLLEARSKIAEELTAEERKIGYDELKRRLVLDDLDLSAEEKKLLKSALRKAKLLLGA